MAGQKRLFGTFGGGDDMTTIRMKRGTTLNLIGLAELPSGNWVATAKVKEPAGDVIGVIDVAVNVMATPDRAGYTHALNLHADAAETAQWTPTRLHCDIAFSCANPPLEVSSATFFLQVEEGVSR
jgi:hypothetical protein